MTRRWFWALALALLSAAPALGQEQSSYPPPGGKGRVVILLSGQSGKNYYEFYGAEVAKLGYYAALYSGNEIFSGDGQGTAHLSQAIEQALAAPQAVRGKVAVIGFSHGGGGALLTATRMSNSVAGVIVYYPATNFIDRFGGMKKFVGDIKVPTLMFAGGKDTYRDCCLIATANSLGAEAKAQGKPLELVVYPDAEHDFNLNTGHYRKTVDTGGGFNGPATADAWNRTVAALKHYLGG